MVEINEAFASVVLAWQKELGFTAGADEPQRRRHRPRPPPRRHRRRPHDQGAARARAHRRPLRPRLDVLRRRHRHRHHHRAPLERQPARGAAAGRRGSQERRCTVRSHLSCSLVLVGACAAAPGARPAHRRARPGSGWSRIRSTATPSTCDLGGVERAGAPHRHRHPGVGRPRPARRVLRPRGQGPPGRAASRRHRGAPRARRRGARPLRPPPRLRVPGRRRPPRQPACWCRRATPRPAPSSPTSPARPSSTGPRTAARPRRPGAVAGVRGHERPRSAPPPG